MAPRRRSAVMPGDPHSIGDMLDVLQDQARRHERVRAGDMAEAMGHRGHAPLLILPALIEISPIGGIPGLPTVLAAIIVVTAIQIVLGREHLWLPGFIERRGVSSGRLERAVARLRPLARRLDGWFHRRLPAFTGRRFVRIAAVAAILLACTVPPLELLPFASTAPMAAIIALGSALLVRDGLLMLVALALQRRGDRLRRLVADRLERDDFRFIHHSRSFRAKSRNVVPGAWLRFSTSLETNGSERYHHTPDPTDCGRSAPS